MLQYSHPKLNEQLHVACCDLISAKLAPIVQIVGLKHLSGQKHGPMCEKLPLFSKTGMKRKKMMGSFIPSWFLTGGTNNLMN